MFTVILIGGALDLPRSTCAKKELPFKNKTFRAETFNSNVCFVGGTYSTREKNILHVSE